MISCKNIHRQFVYKFIINIKNKLQLLIAYAPWKLEGAKQEEKNEITYNSMRVIITWGGVNRLDLNACQNAYPIQWFNSLIKTGIHVINVYLEWQAAVSQSSIACLLYSIHKRSNSWQSSFFFFFSFFFLHFNETNQPMMMLRSTYS